MTIYRSSFLYNDSKLAPEFRTERDLISKGRARKDGELSFEEFCSIYSRKLPNLYVDVLFRMYLVEVVDGEIDPNFKRTRIQSVDQTDPTRPGNETPIPKDSRNTSRSGHVLRTKSLRKNLMDRIQEDKLKNLQLYL